jgi:hypothetical protein
MKQIGENFNKLDVIRKETITHEHRRFDVSYGLLCEITEVTRDKIGISARQLFNGVIRGVAEGKRWGIIAESEMR